MTFKFTAPARRSPVVHAEQRCLCGNLLARLVPGGVEIKCRRCQRVVVLPLEEASTSRR